VRTEQFWTWSESHVRACHGCGGVIRPREPYLEGAAAQTCLSCVLSAVCSLLPGSPREVRVELERDGLPGELSFAVEVDGLRLGAARVDWTIPAGQRVHALLLTVFRAMRAHAAQVGALGPGEWT
jgi:hypothetical protein